MTGDLVLKDRLNFVSRGDHLLNKEITSNIWLAEHWAVQSIQLQNHKLNYQTRILKSENDYWYFPLMVEHKSLSDGQVPLKRYFYLSKL